MFIKWFFLIIFFAVMIACGFFARRKTKSISDFVLGGRNVGPWMSAFAYGTAYFSAVVFVGYAGQFGWRYGISASWIGIGNALLGSLLAWVVLGRRTRIMTNHLFSATMPDFFGKRYNSKNLTLVASAIIFIFLVPYTASVYNGLSRLFEMAFGMPFMYCVIGMAALTAAYVILGGYLATAINDFIQGIIMLIGIVVIIGSVLASEGGLTESLTKLSFVNGAAEEGIRQAGVFTSFFGPDPVGLISVIILTSLGTWGLPQMIHKFYAIKSEKAITTGTVVSTVFAIIIAGGSYFLGGFARLFDSPAIHKDGGGIIFDAIIPSMLANMSDIVIAVTIVLVLSASMSTLASLVITSSSTMTLDFLRRLYKKEPTEKVQLLLMRLLIVFFILVSVVFAINPPTFIAQMMGISWGALAGAFLAPFLYGLYWKKATKTAVWACFAFGVGLTVSNMFLHYISSPITAGAIAIVGGLLVLPVVSVLSKKPEPEYVENIFSCYEETVTVHKAHSLEE